MTFHSTLPVYLIPLVLIGSLVSCGVYLLLERSLTRMLLGLLLVGNGINLLILNVGGPSGNPPIYGRLSAGQNADADPLTQALILTAIVITMGIAAFVLALSYRSYRLTTAEVIDDDAEDTRVAESEPTVEELDDGTAITHPDTDEPDELDALPAAGARDEP